MNSFIKNVVDHIFLHYPAKLSDLCIVLPNRRAGLFFKKQFAAALENNVAVWLPEIYAIEDFIEKLSGLQVIDSTALLFEFYAVYQEITEMPESFDEFSKWAPMLLQDFNEIDRYLVDAEQLFFNLSSIKEIENWSLSAEELTEFQQHYLQFFKLAGTYYNALQSRLLEKHSVYEGMAFRIVAEQLQDKIKLHNWHKIIIAGFNALNVAEEKIIKALVATNKADVIWDADSYYYANPNQEAGKFLRKYIPMFAKAEDAGASVCSDNLITSPKQIHVIGAAKNITQAKVAGNILSTLSKAEMALEKTAVVLADENLLFPVLHALPPDINKINVTMGYPLRNTAPIGLLEIIFNLHENARRLKKAEMRERFYFRDVLKLLSHPYIKYLFIRSELTTHLSNELIKRNYVFVTLDDLLNFLPETVFKTEFERLKPLFLPWTAVSDALATMEYMVDLLRENFNESTSKIALDTEYLFGFSKIIKRIKSLLAEYDFKLEISTFHQLFKQLVATTNLPFYGEPLSGLQIMGVLETRTLDFDTVILLSVNEKILPSGKNHNSFIPFDLKKVFGLPTYSDKDAVFAYHFYRLLQRASTVYLIYNTEQDTFGSGERSRFITQLLHELPKANKNITISEQLVVAGAEEMLEQQLISITKSADILALIQAKALKGYSPSSLNIYRNCSLQFYFQYVTGLKEQEEVEETIGADTLGSVVHKVLELLYQPFKGKDIQPVHITAMKKAAPPLVEEVFGELYNTNELKYGKNLLTLKVAIRFIDRFLTTEHDFLTSLERQNKQLYLEALEQELSYTCVVNGREVLLKGNIDRLDRIGNLYRIIDYKTGKVENGELQFSDWETLLTDKKYNKSFQLLLYALLYARNNNAAFVNGNELQSGIITFRELSAGFKPVKVASSKVLTPQLIDTFESELINLLARILDPTLPFSQTTDLENCTYCGFKNVCNR